MTIRKLWCVLAGIGVLFSLSAMGHEIVSARAVVSGPLDYLREYSTALHKRVGGENGLQKRGIACVGCGDLNGETPPSALIFTYFVNDRNNALLHSTWIMVQRDKGKERDFQVSYDLNVVNPDCSAAFKPPCVQAPYCATGCDTMRGPPCVACTPQ